LVRTCCHFELGALNRNLHLSVAFGGNLAHDANIVRVFVKLFTWVADPVEPRLQNEDSDQTRAGADRHLVEGCEGGHSVSDEAGETKKGEKRSQQVRRRIAQAAEVFVGGDDDVVAELARVEEASSETGDQRQSEATEKYEQICKSPGH